MKKLICRAAVLLTFVGLFAGTPAEAATRIYLRFGPPPIVIEHHAPVRRGYIWRAGYHHWTGHRYAWVRGTWVRPPYARARYVSGRWAREHRGYYWVPGHWSRG